MTCHSSMPCDQIPHSTSHIALVFYKKNPCLYPLPLGPLGVQDIHLSWAHSIATWSTLGSRIRDCGGDYAFTQETGIGGLGLRVGKDSNLMDRIYFLSLLFMLRVFRICKLPIGGLNIALTWSWVKMFLQLTIHLSAVCMRSFLFILEWQKQRGRKELKWEIFSGLRLGPWLLPDALNWNWLKDC